MLGGRSIPLVRVFGIRIGVDPSWFLALFLFIWWLTDYYQSALPGGDDSAAFALATVSALLFFLSILLHELGHAVVAIRNGISIAGIDLWLFGGIAKMSRDTSSPGVEFRVAVAGPVVTLLIAILCAGLGMLAAGGRQRLLERRRLRRRGLGRRVRRDDVLPGQHQRRAAGLQPDPGVPARRRPDRAGDRLEGDRRPHPRHQLRRHDRAGLLLRPDRDRDRGLLGAEIPLLGRSTSSAGCGSSSSACSSGRRPARPPTRPPCCRRSRGSRVADVMDAEPVAIPGT